MPFNPNVSDQRGEMALKGGSVIADLIYQGKAGFGQGIGQGLMAAGQNIASGFNQLGVEQKRRDMAGGSLDFLVREGIIPEDQAAKLLQGPTGKLEGEVNTGMAKWSLLNQVAGDQRSEERQMRYLQAQTNAAANLATYKETLSSRGAQPGADEAQKMTAAGYIWDQTAGKWAVDRSKYRAVDPMTAFLNGGGSAPAQQTAAPVAPAQAAQPQAAMGGYQVGRRYGGKTYLGGDPNNPGSWQ